MEKNKVLISTMVDGSPIQEVYRIRESIMQEFNYDVKAYHKHLRETEPQIREMGFKYATEAELKELRNKKRKY